MAMTDYNWLHVITNSKTIGQTNCYIIYCYNTNLPSDTNTWTCILLHQKFHVNIISITFRNSNMQQAQLMSKARKASSITPFSRTDTFYHKSCHDKLNWSELLFFSPNEMNAVF
jgi:hypothetical protein